MKIFVHFLQLSEAANHNEDISSLTQDDLLAKYVTDTSELKESVKTMGQRNEKLLCELHKQSEEKSMLNEELKSHLDCALQKVQKTQTDMELYQVQVIVYTCTHII